MPVAPPQQLGRYRLLKPLGEGGMGAVILAEDTALGRRVALKIPHFTPGESEEVIQRFRREARMAAQLDDPRLCPVYDVDCVDGVHFLVMGFIEGTPLSRLVGGGRTWPIAHAVALCQHIAGAMALLHQRGIIHRDLKPANVMIRPDGLPVLMDFGLARSFQSNSQNLTAQNQSLGTPAYMAPEQAMGQPGAVGPAADLYALGVILYQMLTGRLPLEANSLPELFGQLLYTQPPPPSQWRPDLPPALNALCLKLLAKEPRQRTSSMEALVTQLGQCLEAQPSARPPTPASLPEAITQTQLTARNAHSTVRTPRRSRSVLALAVGGVLAVGLLVVALFLMMGGSPESATTSVNRLAQETTPTLRSSEKRDVEVPPPVLTARLTPSVPLTLTRGESGTVRLVVDRRDAPGPLAVGLKTEARGLEVRLPKLSATEDEAELSVRALEVCPLGPCRVGLIVTGERGARAEVELDLIIRGPAPTLDVELADTELTLLPGESRPVRFTVRRRHCKGPVVMEEASGDGLEIGLAVVSDDKSEGVVTVRARAGIAAGRRTVRLVVRGPDETRAEANLNVLVKSAPVATPGTDPDKTRLAWKHGLNFQVRKAGEKEFTDRTQRWGLEIFHDKDVTGLVYVTEKGGLGLGSAARADFIGAEVKAPKLFYALELTVREVGEAKFDGKVKRLGVEVFNDVNADNLVYISEAGKIALLPTGNLTAPATLKKPEWFHGLEIGARKGGETDWDKATKVSLEVYRDEHTNQLIYVTDRGGMAIVSAQGAIKPNPNAIQDPDWFYG